MNKRIILIHEKYENDFGFVNKDENNNIIIPKYNNDKNRKLKIYTWGEKISKNIKQDCNLIFDVSKFFCKNNGDIRNLNGTDELIQRSIINHPRFSDLAEKIVKSIEENNSNIISFVCNHGKHRSVGWAEIIKKLYYPKSTLYHLDLKKLKKKN